MIAEGVENVNADLSELSSEFDLSLKSIDNQLKATVSINTQLSVALLDAEIFKLRNEIRALNRDIDKIEKELEDNTAICSDFSSCDGCSGYSNCVWCSSEQLCVDGSEDGPDGDECDV